MVHGEQEAFIMDGITAFLYEYNLIKELAGSRKRKCETHLLEI